MPRRSRKSRVRTTSQSSVEVQLIDNEPASRAAQSSKSSRSEPTPTLVLPKTEFAELLKYVGARGKHTLLGELYTVNQLCFYLKEYIKLRQLYDVEDPRIVHCHGDPLGQVFGVNNFTVDQALGLIKKNMVIIDNPGVHQRHQTPPPTHRHSPADIPQENQQSSSGTEPGTSIAPQIINCQSSSNDESVTPKARCTSSSSSQECVRNLQSIESQQLRADAKNPTSKSTCNVICCERNTEDSSGRLVEQLTESASGQDIATTTRQSLDPVQGSSTQKTREDSSTTSRHKRRRTKSDQPAGGSSEAGSRRRQSSVNIYYNDSAETSGNVCPWYVQVDLQDSDETVYSVQSKVTEYVKDSSDDLWFLDEDISVEIQSTYSTNFEEYELESNLSSHHSNLADDDDGSESPCEEIVVICDDSDTQFWADSELSDTDNSTDDDCELTQSDKWFCRNCDTNNSPLTRHCLRCWNLRPDWVPEKHNPREIEKSSLKLDRAQTVIDRSKPDLGSVLDDKQVDISVVMNKFLQSSSSSSQSSRVQENSLHSSPATKTPFEINSQVQKEIKTSVGEQMETQPSGVISAISANSSHYLVNAVRKYDSLSSQELPQSSAEFKIPSSPSLTPLDSGQYKLKGSHIAKLSLPCNDSGVASMNSSQESLTSNTDFMGSDTLKSPTKGAPVQQTSSFMYSPRKTVSPKVLMSPRCQNRKLSPRKRLSPFPAKPYSKSPQQTFFPFNSPVKRALRQEQAACSAAASSQEVFSSDAIKRLQFAEPVLSPRKQSQNVVEFADPCVICMTKPKEASIIHGKTGHQVCCYVCAKQLKRRGKSCPVCRRPIQRVVKNYLV